MGVGAATYDKGYSWFVLLASFSLFALYANNAVSHGILLPEFLDYFRVTKAEASLPSSLLFGVSGIIGVVIGPLTKRFGTRMVVMAGGLLSGISIFAAGFSPSLMAVTILFGILPGIGTGCNLVGGTLGILHYFKKRRSLAFGIAGAGYSTGSLSSPQIVRFTISQFGWRGALLIQGAIQLNVIVCGALLRPQPEAEIGPERGSTKRKTWKEKMKDVFDFTLFQNAKFSVYLVSCFLIASGHIIPYLYLPARALKTGSTHSQAATLVTIMALCSGIFRAVFGWIGGFLGVQRTLFHGLSMVMIGILYFVSTFLYKYIYLAVFAALCGIISAVYMAYENTILGDIITPEKFAHATGFFLCISGISCLVGPPIAGMLVDLSGVYGTPFLVFGVVMITGGVFSFILYMLQKREISRATGSNQVFT